MKKILLPLLLMLLPLIASAYSVEIDGIYYNIVYNAAEVTYKDKNYNSYSGSVAIPASITYSGETYNVTSIGSYAFQGCSGLTSIEIPNSVTSIGSYAFQGCSGLTSIEIPNSVTQIYNNAFYSCTGLTSIGIPNSVTNIGAYAFYGCTSLTSIEIPNSVTSIGYMAFNYCSGLTSVTMGNNVTSIDSYAFYNCTGLSAVHITDLAAWCKINFNYQESNPLRYAKHLYLNGEEIKDLVIPNGVTRIGRFAFYSCSDITSIEISNSVSIIGDQAFLGCSSLTSIDIPNSIITIGDYAFYGCSGLTSLVIGNNVTNIGKEAFSGCTSIPSLYIPQSMNSIDESAFNDCTGLVSIVVDSENPKYDSRDDCNAIIETSTNKLIIGCRNTVIPQSVTDYGQYGLANCVNLKLPEGIEEIPNLYNCKALESITIPNSIKKINDYSFNGCSSLKNIIIEDGDEELTFETFYTYSGYQSKWYKDNPLDSVYLGRNYKTSYYTYYPFREHPTLRAVAFGNNVKSIGDCAFRDCRNLQSIKLGSQLETIGYDAFWNSSNLDTIIISPSVKTIGSNAFYCSHISTLIIEDGEDLELYNGSKGIEFKGTSIDSLYLGRSNVNMVFKRIKHFTIGHINKIGSAGGDTINVLDILDAPDTLDIPVYKNSNYLGGRVNYYYTTPFNNKTIDSLYCNRILSVNDTYHETPTVYPFQGVASSFKLEIGRDLTDIADGMFYGCKIPSLFIPNNIRHISPTAFNDCSTLNSLTIEDDTEPLDFGKGNNFYGCQLRDVYLGRNMQYSTDSPFNSNKEGLSHIIWGENVTEIPDNAFLGLKNLRTLTLPLKLQKIGDKAFYGCEGLTSLTIPNSVTEIGMQAFDLCRNLKALTMEDGEEVLTFTAPESNLNNAFQNSPLEDIYLGRNISFTNSSPLSIIESLKTLTIGSEVTHLADRTFVGCPNLNNVTSYANAVPTTGENVFTPSYLPNDTLHVPYELYNQYKVAPTWKDFGIIVNFEGLYNLTYIVDGEVYKESVIEQHSPITPEAEPTKEGYSFSGWSEIPETMPAHDVTITGYFTANKYNLIYQVDGVEYKTYEVEYGATITPEEEPTKEGYTFSGWSEIPETMPAHDVTITGTFSVNSYKLTYMVDGEEYKSLNVEYGATITPEAEPEKDGYIFSGWSEIPETMPAHDVTVTGTFTLDTGINQMLSNENGDAMIFTIDGRRVNKLQKNMNIIRMKDGTTRKVIKK